MGDLLEGVCTRGLLRFLQWKEGLAAAYVQADSSLRSEWVLFVHLWHFTEVLSLKVRDNI